MSDIQLHRRDLNLLVTFEILMSEGSLVGAAEKLGKTPSTVSHALARLRSQVGVRRYAKGWEEWIGLALV